MGKFTVLLIYPKLNYDLVMEFWKQEAEINQLQVFDQHEIRTVLIAPSEMRLVVHLDDIPISERRKVQVTFPAVKL